LDCVPYLRLGATAATAAVMLGALTCMPLLALAVGNGAQPCPDLIGVVADETPSILGPATLTSAQLEAWWDSAGRAQPGQLNAPVADVIALYISEGQIEGVRGDLALAQVVLETGWFTSGDTGRNNFAGIAHYDHTDGGRSFDTPAEGVRAHIQLLKKFAAGNDTPLARPDVAPNALAHADTWGQLAGTWATNPNYWTAISGVYAQMLTFAGTSEPDGFLTTAPCGPIGGGQVVGGYSLPVGRHWYDEQPVWFTKPHHDYPAADIPVPTGTPIYSMVAGTVAGTPTSGRCGIGVVVNGDDGAQYTYCHGLPGSQVVAVGERVDSGQQVMLSASTGNSTGPHLHLGIRISGQQRCPQPLLVAIADGAPVDAVTLPASGCSY
jgi:murein DD-endopeptidase MepM/ murein hydrolase activator NlpD